MKMKSFRFNWMLTFVRFFSVLLLYFNRILITKKQATTKINKSVAARKQQKGRADQPLLIKSESMDCAMEINQYSNKIHLYIHIIQLHTPNTYQSAKATTNSTRQIVRSVALGSEKSIFSRQFSNWNHMLLWSLWSANLQRKVFHCTVVYCVHLAPLAHFSIYIYLSLSFFSYSKTNQLQFIWNSIFNFFGKHFAHCHQKCIIYDCCLRTAMSYLHTIWQLTFFCCYVPNAFKRFAPFGRFYAFNCSNILFYMTVRSECVAVNVV